jgi:threonine synthase
MPVNYVSTRGSGPAQSFEEVLLSGLARDGGLYVPDGWPQVAMDDIRALAPMPYTDIVTRIVRPFIEVELVSDADLSRIVEAAYAGFRHPEIAPLQQLDEDTWILELFHGPTLAFKDFALQLLGGLFDHVLGLRGERLTIVGATSGDTGSAAIEACRDRENLDIFMLFPEGRVSDVQRRQMTTVSSSNVYNLALRGTFDDCQDLVKAMFADHGLRDSLGLSAVNSINWARVMGQTAYYFSAAARMGAPDARLSFIVPTGNFGNVYAGYVARQMGLPIERLVVASNRNDILYRFFDQGDMSITGVEPSLSRSEGTLPDSRRLSADTRSLFLAQRLDDTETLDVIRSVHEETGMLIDPHTAVAVGAARKTPRDGTRRIVLATAHPAKFPDAVEKATGIRPDLPSHLADLFERRERAETLDNDFPTVRGYVVKHATVRNAS